MITKKHILTIFILSIILCLGCIKSSRKITAEEEPTFTNDAIKTKITDVKVSGEDVIITGEVENNDSFARSIAQLPSYILVVPKGGNIKTDQRYVKFSSDLQTLEPGDKKNMTITADGIKSNEYLESIYIKYTPIVPENGQPKNKIANFGETFIQFKDPAKE